MRLICFGCGGLSRCGCLEKSQLTAVEKVETGSAFKEMKPYVMLQQPIASATALYCHPWIWGGIEERTWCHTMDPVLLIKWHRGMNMQLFVRSPDLVWMQPNNGIKLSNSAWSFITDLIEMFCDRFIKTVITECSVPEQCRDTDSTVPPHQCWSLLGYCCLSSDSQYQELLVFPCWRENMIHRDLQHLVGPVYGQFKEIKHYIVILLAQIPDMVWFTSVRHPVCKQRI